MSKPIMLIIGTRPEGIKMLPVYFALKKKHIPVIICSTTQHTHLLKEVFDVFDVKPDIELHIMQPNQDLFHITSEVLERTKSVFQHHQPAMVLVHGDTTSSMAAALAAFYLHIPVGHVEAGLRTFDVHNPFPEEMNRRFIDMIAQYHFAPTPTAVNNLKTSDLTHKHIFFTGNTIVDALQFMQKQIETKQLKINSTIVEQLSLCKRDNKKMLLLTTHRRESFDGGITRILKTIKQFAMQHSEYAIFYPYHPNPNISDAIEQSGIKECPAVFIHKPLCYKEMVYLLLHADMIATDSGGIQEEAISLSKPMIILREKTERPEGIETGLARLVGTNPQHILTALEHYTAYPPETNHQMPYGNGNASQIIADIINQELYTPLFNHQSFEKKEFRL